MFRPSLRLPDALPSMSSVNELGCVRTASFCGTPFVLRCAHANAPVMTSVELATTAARRSTGVSSLNGAAAQLASTGGAARKRVASDIPINSLTNDSLESEVFRDTGGEEPEEHRIAHAKQAQHLALE